MGTAPLLPDDRAFDPETLVAMGTAYSTACRSLGVSERWNDEMASLIAAKIVQMAAAGEHDPVRLREGVMRWAASAA